MLARVAAIAVLVGLTVGAPGVGAAAARLDLNSATHEQLTELPGIGSAKAAAIIEERSMAPFTSVDDLERVKGIGPSLVSDLRGRVTVVKKKD